MWRNSITFLLFFSCVLVLMAVIRILQGQDYTEPFDASTIDALSTPSSAYRGMAEDEIDVARKPFLEFNDRFFLNTLTSAQSTNKVDDSTWTTVVVQSKNDDTQQQRVSQLVENILNRALHPNDPNLFHVVRFELESVKQSPDKKLWTVKASMILHRTGKSYGAALTTRTLHDMTANSSSLLSFELKGFVFEDKMDPEGDVVAKNFYGEDDQVASVDMLQMRILPNKKDQERLVCKQLKDMKATRGVDYALSSEKMNCDG